METLSFILGIASVIAVAMVGVMFGMYRAIQNIKSEQVGHTEWLNDTNRIMNQQEDAINRRLDEIVREHYNHIDELHRSVDSRFDKFENKINQQLPNKKGY